MTSPSLMFWVELPEPTSWLTSGPTVIQSSRESWPLSTASTVSRAVITLVMLAGYTLS